MGKNQQSLVYILQDLRINLSNDSEFCKTCNNQRHAVLNNREGALIGVSLDNFKKLYFASYWMWKVPDSCDASRVVE